MRLFISMFLFVTVSGCTGSSITGSENGVSFEIEGQGGLAYRGQLSRIGKKAEEHCAQYGKSAEMIEKAQTFVRFACVSEPQ